jgi:dipeptidase
MDFNFDTSPSNEAQNNNPPQEQGESKLTNLDQMLNMDFQPFTENNEENQKNNQSSNQDFNMDFISNNINPSSPKIDDEEQKRILDRQKETEERKQKIKEKMQKEEELRNEIRKKASEYLVEFEEKRQENIAKRRKALEEKNSETNNNTSGGMNNTDSWQKINSNIDLKDSDYKGSKDVQRMREAMMNRTNDPNSKPLEHFFG